MSLEEHYCGDDAWKAFLSVHTQQSLSGDRFEPEQFHDAIEISEQNREILIVAVSYFGTAKTKLWLDEAIPALDGETPRHCMLDRGAPKLNQRLREYLMRLPV